MLKKERRVNCNLNFTSPSPKYFLRVTRFMKERIQRVNNLIKKEISEILLRENDFPPDILVTITRVETSANLIQAKVWVSVMPENKGKVVVGNLNKQIYRIQQKINKRLKMRPIPRIIFRQDKEIVMAGRIEEILEKLKKEKK